MSLYEDLLQKQFLPHAYEDWAEYRNAISNYLIASTAADSTLAIFGAGCCNDWDLSLLAGHFSSITLIDNNLPSMKQALKRYQLESYPTIHLDECNLTGLYGSDYEKSVIHSLSRKSYLVLPSIRSFRSVQRWLFCIRLMRKPKSISSAMAVMLLIILWLLDFTASLIIWLPGSGILLQKPVTGRTNG